MKEFAGTERQTADGRTLKKRVSLFCDLRKPSLRRKEKARGGGCFCVFGEVLHDFSWGRRHMVLRRSLSLVIFYNKIRLLPL